MELRQYGRMLRGHWWLVTAATLAGLLCAAILTTTAPPSYESTTKLLVSAQNAGADPGESYQGDLLAGARVATYADLLTGPAVIQAVIDRLELPDSVRSLQGRVTVAVPEATTLITVTVADRSPERARVMAEAVAAEFRQYVAGIDGATAVRISTVEPATVPADPAAPNHPLDLVLGLLAGLALGLAAAVLREYFDGRVIDESDATSLTGVPVLGTVPASGRRNARRRDRSSNGDDTAYRDLASILQHLQENRGGGPVTVLGLTRGDGASAVVANLARSLARSAVRVILIAGNRTERRTGSALAGSRPDLVDVLAGRAPVDRALCPADDEPGLLLLPAHDSGGSWPALDSRQVTKLVAELHEKADLVLIDAPPLDESVDGVVLAASTHGAILVVSPGRTRRRDLARAVERMQDLSTAPLGVVFNLAAGSAGNGGLRLVSRRSR